MKRFCTSCRINKPNSAFVWPDGRETKSCVMCVLKRREQRAANRQEPHKPKRVSFPTPGWMREPNMNPMGG